MKDKFRENFKIALPAALVTLVIILVLSLGTDISGTVQNDYNLLELIPYLIVLVGGIVGINVFIVLLLGILSGSIIVVAEGAVAATDLLGNMGTGAAGMFETTMVAVQRRSRGDASHAGAERLRLRGLVHRRRRRHCSYCRYRLRRKHNPVRPVD